MKQKVWHLQYWQRRQQALSHGECLIAVAGFVQHWEVLRHCVALIGDLLRLAPEWRLYLALHIAARISSLIQGTPGESLSLNATALNMSELSLVRGESQVPSQAQGSSPR